MNTKGVPLNRPLARDEQARMFIEASALAAIAIGKETATRDPLAWWCLVEAMVNFAGRNATEARKYHLRERGLA